MTRDRHTQNAMWFSRMKERPVLCEYRLTEAMQLATKASDCSTAAYCERKTENEIRNTLVGHFGKSRRERGEVSRVTRKGLFFFFLRNRSRCSNSETTHTGARVSYVCIQNVCEFVSAFVNNRIETNEWNYPEDGQKWFYDAWYL